MLKESLKKFLPSPILRLIRRIKFSVKLSSNCFCDYKAYLRWSATDYPLKTQEQLRAIIVVNYHKIEKGLSLKNSRPGFGIAAVNQLVADVRDYIKKYGNDATVEIANKVLNAYQVFNQKTGAENHALEKNIQQLLEISNNVGNNLVSGGVKTVLKDEIIKSACLPLESFFQSRYSIRHFSDEVVEMHLINRAISMASKTPSVCNRQTCKVYIFSDLSQKAQLLKYQNGNRGFGEQIDKLLIVTSNLQDFISVGERNQCWIDGGMFAMSVVYALHSLGLGTCCLNLSIENDTADALHTVAQIPSYESLIMMIAVGHLPASLNVACSFRKDLSEILVPR